MEEEQLKKELFNMVYKWGRVGLVVDEHCPAFVDLMEKIESIACRDRERHGTT